MKKIRLLLVDDHAVVRFGLRMMLGNEEDIDIVGEAENARGAIDLLVKLSPDVVLMDIGLPDRSGIETTKEIKNLSPETAVIALTIHEDEQYFFQMLNAGASGYVPKRAAPDELLAAIRAVSKNEMYLYPSLAKFLIRHYLHSSNPPSMKKNDNLLTARETEVLVKLADGHSNAEIGEMLHISPNTVARHRENIMSKLNLHSRADLVRYAIRTGVIQA